MHEAKQMTTARAVGAASSPVLRGLGVSNGARLLDSQEWHQNREETVYLPALGGDGPKLR